MPLPVWSRQLICGQFKWKYIETVLWIPLECEVLPEFQKCEILVQINLASEHRIAGGLCQTRQMHLLIEILHHFFFGDAKWNITNV